MAVMLLFFFSLLQVVLCLRTCPSTIRRPSFVDDITNMFTYIGKSPSLTNSNCWPCGGLCTLSGSMLAIMSEPPFYPTCLPFLSRCRFITLLLLVMSGVEINPEPCQTSFRLGVLNVNGATYIRQRG